MTTTKIILVVKKVDERENHPGRLSGGDFLLPK
jgi:hypothetical protein